MNPIRILKEKIYHAHGYKPIAVGLIPIIKDNKEGILLISKFNKPHLPFERIANGESWEESFARTMELMGMRINPNEFSFYCANSSPYGHAIKIYGLSNQIRNLDTQSTYLVGSRETEVYSSHEEVYKWVWAMKRNDESFMESHRPLWWDSWNGKE